MGCCGGVEKIIYSKTENAGHWKEPRIPSPSTLLENRVATPEDSMIIPSYGGIGPAPWGCRYLSHARAGLPNRTLLAICGVPGLIRWSKMLNL